MVESICICHLNWGTKCKLRCMCGSVWVSIEDCFSLYVIFCACMKSSKMMGLSLALFMLRAMAHLTRFRSMCALSANFWSLLI